MQCTLERLFGTTVHCCRHSQPPLSMMTRHLEAKARTEPRMNGRVAQVLPQWPLLFWLRGSSQFQHILEEMAHRHIRVNQSTLYRQRPRLVIFASRVFSPRVSRYTQNHGLLVSVLLSEQEGVKLLRVPALPLSRKCL